MPQLPQTLNNRPSINVPPPSGHRRIYERTFLRKRPPSNPHKNRPSANPICEPTPKLELQEGLLGNWNEHINSSISLSDFYQESEPSNKYRIFYNTLMAANKSSGIKLKKHRMTFNQSPLKCGGTRTAGEQSPNQEKREMHAIPKEEG